jgi:hypothetical protein
MVIFRSFAPFSSLGDKNEGKGMKQSCVSDLQECTATIKNNNNRQ